MFEDKFCKYCGAPLQAGSAFCPKCGSRVVAGAGAAATAGAATGTVPPTPPPPYQRQRREKDQEKHEEKQEKGEKGKKGREGDVTGGIFGGGILIWLGITFYMATTHIITWNQWWPYFLVGLGAMLILLGLWRGMKRGTMQPFLGFLIGGTVLLLIGIGSIFADSTWWPLWVIALGVVIIVVVLTNLRRMPKP